jgi:uncharacterized membrane protein
MSMPFNMIHPAIIFAIATACSLIIFFAIRLSLHFSYVKVLGKRPFVNRHVEAIRRRGLPYVKRYGFLGLVLFVAIPLPTTGVYGGTLLSWLLGMNWSTSLLAVMIGATVSNGIVALSAFGIMKAVHLVG